MGVGSDDAVVIKLGKKAGEASVITVNFPDKTGLGCDLCRIILEFGRCITRGVPIDGHEQAIHRHISHLQKRVEQLRFELTQMEKVRDRGDEDLYSRLDAAYLSEDDNAEVDVQDEGDEAYLETFDGPADDENGGADVETENYDRSAEQQSVGSFNSVLDDYYNRLNETSEPDAQTSAQSVTHTS